MTTSALSAGLMVHQGRLAYLQILALALFVGLLFAFLC